MANRTPDLDAREAPSLASDGEARGGGRERYAHVPKHGS